MEFRKGITYLVNTDENATPEREEAIAPKEQKETISKRIPLLPAQNIALFPHMTFPLKLHKKSEIELIEKIHSKEGHIGLIATKNDTSYPTIKDFHSVGTVAKILKVIHLSKVEVIAVLQGKERFSIEKIPHKKPHLSAQIKLLKNQPLNNTHKRTEVLIQSIKETAFKLLTNMPDVPTEVHMMIDNIQNPDFLVYYITSSLIGFTKSQQILSLSSGLKRATLLLKHLLKDLEFLKIQKQIHRKVHTDINLQQRKIYLKQQIKVLQEELGESSPDQYEEIEELRLKSESLSWPSHVTQHFNKTLQKAARLHPSSAEYTNFINYAQTFSEIPWNTHQEGNTNLQKAKNILDKAHYGMDKVKERILTLLAVQKLKKSNQGKILCFHGPPGVGKTSLCKSIALALGRKYARISLGGLHDEAELRGHRKTYIGAMIGQIMNAFKTTGTNNPVIVLDEIDKLDASKGNPAAVLLEILDPAQNHAFLDNFLGVPFDLSKTIFIATANDIHNILPALADRLEIIKIDGYPTEEKIEIAKKHLIPNAKEENGLQNSDIAIPTHAVKHIIEHYTNESGVRQLTREISKVCSKTAKSIVFKTPHLKRISIKDIPSFLGKTKFDKETYQKIEKPGVSIGLAWTPTGGEILFIEALLYQGEGKLITSGQLGEVMEESAITALSYLKAHATQLNINEKLFKKYDLHIHVPDGATPKDGPSAGITLLTAIASLYTQRKIKDKLAMTGEITLRGNVLEVGGIQEKVLAARRANITDIILCHKNKKDIEEINPKYLTNLKFHYVNKVAEVLNIALQPNPIPHRLPSAP